MSNEQQRADDDDGDDAVTIQQSLVSLAYDEWSDSKKQPQRRKANLKTLRHTTTELMKFDDTVNASDHNRSPGSLHRLYNNTFRILPIYFSALNAIIYFGKQFSVSW